MGAILPLDAPCAKGWIPYALEECSRMPEARAILEDLQDAIESLAPDYRNLSEVFDQYLLSHVAPDNHRPKILRHLDRHWFGDDRGEAYFPDQDVAAIYARGILSTLELSLRSSGQPIPITSWWIVDAPDVKMLSFAEVDGRRSAEGVVTLLIMTPRPLGTPDSRRFILRDEAEVWVAEEVEGLVVARRVGKSEVAIRPRESVDA